MDTQQDKLETSTPTSMKTSTTMSMETKKEIELSDKDYGKTIDAVDEFLSQDENTISEYVKTYIHNEKVSIY